MESLEPRLLAKYAKPPLELPRRYGTLFVGVVHSLLFSVKSLVDFLHRKDTILSEHVLSNVECEL